MARKIYNIVTKTIFVFVILIVGLLLYYAGKRLITKDKTASIFGYSFYHVSTNSMVPVINGGDFIVVKERKEYRVGMDITYQLDKNSTPITHRIVEIDGNTIITEGVNNDGDRDDPFDVSCIVGEVVFVWRNYYDFINFVSSPTGIILIAVGVFGIIEVISLIDKLIEKTENKKKENVIENS